MKSRLVALAALTALAQFAGSDASEVGVIRVSPPTPMPRLASTSNSVGPWSYAKKRRGSYARTNRAARKRRNQIRNRLAHRGA